MVRWRIIHRSLIYGLILKYNIFARAIHVSKCTFVVDFAKFTLSIIQLMPQRKIHKLSKLIIYYLIGSFNFNSILIIHSFRNFIWHIPTLLLLHLVDSTGGLFPDCNVCSLSSFCHHRIKFLLLSNNLINIRLMGFPYDYFIWI